MEGGEGGEEVGQGVRDAHRQACTYKTYHMCDQCEHAPQHERGTQSQRASRARARARRDITRPADEGHPAGTLIAQVGGGKRAGDEVCMSVV